MNEVRAHALAKDLAAKVTTQGVGTYALNGDDRYDRVMRTHGSQVETGVAPALLLHPETAEHDTEALTWWLTMWPAGAESELTLVPAEVDGWYTLHPTRHVEDDDDAVQEVWARDARWLWSLETQSLVEITPTEGED